MIASGLPEIALAFAVVCAAPGPANLAVAVRAMAGGQGAALPMALGLAIGLAVWGIAAATGLGALLAASSTALIVLKVLGAAYLGWLAIGCARSAGSPDAPTPPAATSGFRAGLLLNLSNPKAVLAWLAALSVGLPCDAGTPTVVTATLTCAAIGRVNYLLWALAFSRPAAMAVYQRARRRIDAACAALFSLAAFALLRSALAR